MIVVFVVLLLISYLIVLTAKVVSKSKEESNGDGRNFFKRGKESKNSSSKVDAKTLAIISSCIDSYRKDTDPNYIIKSVKEN